MAQNLIIVESPAKMKTIKGFLDNSYDVEASMGHVRDLPKSTMGVDIEHDFEPKYITIKGKNALIADLKKAAAKAERIYLATDPDREGEAISWHLKTALGPRNAKKISRISFNEITKTAIENALKNPRDIDMDLVDAQQGRRVIDRIVGYSISPILWQKIRGGLSAGRVQSVALRMICERDAEIKAFVPEEYHTVEGTIKHGEQTARFLYYGENGKKKELKTADEAMEIVNDVKGGKLLITAVSDSERFRNAPLPFTTSTLQQEASRRLNFQARQTMSVAQKLYEEGLITYMRTDSTRVSAEAVKAAKNYIMEHFGEKYVSTRSGNTGKKAANVQDAHEAIRPSHIENTPEKLGGSLSRDEARLYQLVWMRFIASRMTRAVFAATKVTMEHGTHTFTATGSSLKFDGFLKVYDNVSADEEDKQDLSFLKKGNEVVPDSLQDIQHFTQPPAHFNDASLVKALEEDGIGRPSTYAPTITTLLSRNYVTREKKNLISTELGIAVNKLMTEAFPKVVDTGFTANMEEELDKVALGKINWKDCIREYYPDLKESVENAKKSHERIKVADEPTDEICEKCGRPMVIKIGRYGRFLACSGFPECKNTRPLVEKSKVKCPKCGSDMVKRYTKKGHHPFYACTNKECDYLSWTNPANKQKENPKDEPVTVHGSGEAQVNGPIVPD